MKDKLYAARIKARALTILDVPEDRREAVLDLLPLSDRKRAKKMLEEAE